MTTLKIKITEYLKFFGNEVNFLLFFNPYAPVSSIVAKEMIGIRRSR